MRIEGTWQDRTVEVNTAGPSDWAQPFHISAVGSKKQETWDMFTNSCDYRPAAPPRTNATADYPEMANEFLLHAKLGCFADRYAIPELATLCLENLRLSLLHCECQSTRIRGIAELLAYTVNNTPPLYDLNSENLRLVVLSFVVIVFELLMKDDIFQELLDNGGDVVKELLLLLQRRLD